MGFHGFRGASWSSFLKLLIGGKIGIDTIWLLFYCGQTVIRSSGAAWNFSGCESEIQMICQSFGDSKLFATSISMLIGSSPFKELLSFDFLTLTNFSLDAENSIAFFVCVYASGILILIQYWFIYCHWCHCVFLPDYVVAVFVPVLLATRQLQQSRYNSPLHLHGLRLLGATKTPKGSNIRGSLEEPVNRYSMCKYSPFGNSKKYFTVGYRNMW